MSISCRRLLQRIFRKIASLLEPQPWDGIYTKWSDIPQEGAAFESDTWTQESEKTLNRLRQESSSGRFLPKEILPEHVLLPFFLSVLAQKQQKVRVIDFGGGYGILYEQIRRCMTDMNRVEYHVLEQPGVSERAAELWQNVPSIRFHTGQPEITSPVDILFLSSSLQYQEDYAGFLSGLVRRYKPVYILFVKLSAGDIPTYLTAQKNLSGSVIPYWFLNVREVVSLLEKDGYSLLYKSVLDKEYAQGNFPASHRMGYASNLLFVKN